MRRTTICRSEAARLAAVAVLVCAAAPVAAQQPTVIQRPIQQAQRAAQQSGQQTAAQQQPTQQQPAAQQRPAQQPAGAAQVSTAQGRPLGPVPATHTVQQGETLWGLAQQFLGDALLWPEIYRLNTTVVEDPHWIFPGEELRLVAGEEQAAAPAPAAADTAPAGNVEVTPTPEAAPAQAARSRVLPGADQPTIFSQQQAARAQQNILQIQEMRAYRGVREGEFYAAAFLTDSRSLEAGVLGANVEQTAVSRLANRETTALYSTVTVTPPGGTSYKKGDLLLAYRVGRAILGFGEVIEPIGLLAVTSDGEAGQPVTAQVRALYGQMDLGALLFKVQPFRYDSNAHAVPVDSGITGAVIATRRDGELTTIQDELFIDRGSDDGVHLGDIFHISAPASSSELVRDQADALVVKLEAKTATVLVLQVSQPDIRPGATATQVRRMPS